MKTLRWNKPTRTFPSVVSDLNTIFNDGFFNDKWLEPVFRDKWPTTSNPAVNVREDEGQFALELAAPGLKKGDFHIDVDHSLLTIEAKNESTKETENEGYTRREFNFTSFKRTFTLPETVDVEKIAGKYDNGVLHVSLPKLEEVAKAKRNIAIK